MTENWDRAYREAPEIFDAFARAEDPEGRIVDALRRHADLDRRDVLEIGCGTGRYSEALARGAARYVGLEKTPQMLALARTTLTPGGAQLLCGDARRIPLPAASVDRVLALWVLVNMRPDARAEALAETDRVLRRKAGCALWLVENRWSGEFQRLRGRRAEVEETRIRDLMGTAGFSLVEQIETELRFPSPGEATRVLGYLCGEPVRRRLEARPLASLTHHVVILQRPASRS